MNIEIGNWVVDNGGGYCKVIRLGYDNEGGGNIDAVWGYWSDVKEEELLFIDADSVEFVFKTEKEAKALADIMRGV